MRITSLIGCLVLSAGLFSACVQPPTDAEQQRTEPIVYGADDRVELGQISDPRLRGFANATAALFVGSDVSCDGPSCTLATQPLESTFGPMCEGELMRGQLNGAYCTAFLVAPDVMVTAGHCLDDCRVLGSGQDTKVVFGFGVAADGVQVKTEIPSVDVYQCVAMLGRAYTGGTSERDQDWSVFRVDRAVAGRNPLAARAPGTSIEGDPALLIIGHPEGTPEKLSGNGHVRVNDPTVPRFYASLEHMPGNSGSPVINAVTGLVEGILVTTPSSLQFETVADGKGGTCQKERVCDEQLGCGSDTAPDNWAGVMRIGSALSCHDGARNGFETDLDCGGLECTGCPLGQACTRDRDCSSGRCDGARCAPAFCSDGVKDHGETGADCGQACNVPCPSGQGCSEPLDCLSNSCVNGTCQEPSCGDGRYNGDESDIDCGGSCPKCRAGAVCWSEFDCQSNTCDFATCIDPTCPDGTRDGNETDVDCGGSCLVCALGQKCAVDGDCDNAGCIGGVCRTSSCRNGVRDGNETGRDCGGECAPCALGGQCNAGSDCSSGFCRDRRCSNPECFDHRKNGHESDRDCGGECRKCGLFQHCERASDCETGACILHLCLKPLPFRKWEFGNGH